MRGSDVFDSAALESNRAGGLGESQLPWLRRERRSSRLFSLFMSAAGFVLGFWLLASEVDIGIFKPLGGVALLALGAVYLVRFIGFDGLSRDLRRPDVRSSEGVVAGLHEHLGGAPSGYDVYTLILDGRRIDATKEQVDAAPDGSRVRLYYLARSGRAINWERLPDLPEPPSMPDPERESLKHAIVGRWSDGVMTVEFHPGGLSTLLYPNGRRTDGRWSLDPQGRLTSDVSGGSDAVQVSITSEGMTLSERGGAKNYTRVG